MMMKKIFNLMKMKNKIFLWLCIMFVIAIKVQAQVTIFSENFESSVFPNNNLISMGGTGTPPPAGATFYQSSTTIQSTSGGCTQVIPGYDIPTSECPHYAQAGANTYCCVNSCGTCYRNLWTISNGAGAIQGKSLGVCAWSANSATDALVGVFNAHKLTTDRWIFTNIDFYGFKDISLQFDWKCGGLANTEYGRVELREYDKVNQITGKVIFTFNSSTTGQQNYYGMSSKATDILNFPASVNGTAVGISFRYVCSSSNTPTQSFIIDNLVLKACPTILPTTGLSPNGTGNVVTTISNGASTIIYRSDTYGKFANSSAGLSYQWQKSTDNVNWTDVSGTAANLNTGSLTQTTYYRCIIKAGACEQLISNTVTVNVNAPPCTPPTLNITSPSSICSNTSTHTFTATSTVSSGWEYQWQPVSSTWSSSLSYTANSPASGNYTLQARQTGNTSCVTSVSQFLSVTPPVTPNFSFGTSLSYCPGTTPTPLPSFSNNSPQITGTWQPSSTINTQYEGVSTYTFKPNSGQCANDVSVTVSINNNVTPVFDFGTTLSYCLNATPAPLPTISYNGISGTWNPSFVNTSVTGNSIYTFTPNTGQCGVPATITVSVSDPLTPMFYLTSSYCIGATPDFLPTVSNNGIIGTWNPSDINTLAAGTTTYTFTPDINACGVPINLTVIVSDVLSAPFYVTACEVYHWQGVDYTESGIHSERSTTPEGCLVDSILHLTIFNPYLSILSASTFCDSGFVVLTAQTNVPDIKWSTGETTPVITAGKPGVYTATVTERSTQNECTLTDTVLLPYCDYEIYIPNAFKASEPSQNQSFTLHPFYTSKIESLELYIYNRWGNLVYYTTDVNFAWCGEERGKNPDPGDYNYNKFGNTSYAYVMRVVFKDRSNKVYSGSITVL